jgi:hypothetical protein
MPHREKITYFILAKFNIVTFLTKALLAGVLIYNTSKRQLSVNLATTKVMKKKNHYRISLR